MARRARAHTERALRQRYGHASVQEWQVALEKDEADLRHMQRCLAMLEAGGQPASEPFLTAAGARQNIVGLRAAIRNKKKLLGLSRGPRRARARWRTR